MTSSARPWTTPGSPTGRCPRPRSDKLRVTSCRPIGTGQLRSLPVATPRQPRGCVGQSEVPKATTARAPATPGLRRRQGLWRPHGCGDTPGCDDCKGCGEPMGYSASSGCDGILACGDSMGCDSAMHTANLGPHTQGDGDDIVLPGHRIQAHIRGPCGTRGRQKHKKGGSDDPWAMHSATPWALATAHAATPGACSAKVDAEPHVDHGRHACAEVAPRHRAPHGGRPG